MNSRATKLTGLSDLGGGNLAANAEGDHPLQRTCQRRTTRPALIEAWAARNLSRKQYAGYMMWALRRAPLFRRTGRPALRLIGPTHNTARHGPVADASQARPMSLLTAIL